MLHCDVLFTSLLDYGCLAQGNAVQEHFQVGQVKRVEAQLELASGQMGIHLVAVALQLDTAIFAHFAELAPEESFAQRFRISAAHLLQPLLVAFQRGLVSFAVHVAMVDQFQPGPKGLVQLRQGGNFGNLHLGQELEADCFKKPLLFAFPFRRIGCGMDLLDAQGSTRHGKLGGLVDLAVVHVDGLGDAAAQDAHLQHPLHTWQSLIEEKFCIRHQAGMVIQEAEQVSADFLAGKVRVGQPRTKHHVPLPQTIGVVTLEALEDPPRLGQQTASFPVGA